MALKVFNWCVSLILFVCVFFQSQAQRLSVSNGLVRFSSEDKDMLFSAYSNELSGKVDIHQQTFSFHIDMGTFQGFRCALLKMHFNTTYMECKAFPDAAFTGYFLDNTDISKEGDYYVRAKGRLHIHGVTQYKIVRVHIVNKNSKINFDTRMSITISDFDIRVQKIWIKRITPDIIIDVSGTMLVAEK